MSDCVWPYGLQPTRLCPWDSASKNTGVGCRALLQGSSPPRDWSEFLKSLHWQAGSLPLGATWKALKFISRPHLDWAEIKFPLTTEEIVYFIEPHNTLYSPRFQASMFNILKRKFNYITFTEYVLCSESNCNANHYNDTKKFDL